MTSTFRCVAVFTLAVFNLGTTSFHPGAVAQQSETVGIKRPIVSKVEPAYPHMARKARLTGMVRLRVKVDARGQVQSIKVLGGPPIFVQSAVEATTKWRWKRLGNDTEEVVQIRFENP